jgi:D-glycero-D-manno-heptose 1,7-bisphosphate phosphatase
VEESRAVDCVLCDRDGTLVVDVPYNGNPERVVPLPGVAHGLARLRAAGIRLAIVSNQSGVAQGLLTPTEVEAVNRRVTELLGPFSAVFWCPHAPGDGCACRKPAPGMVHRAACALGIPVERSALVGDTGADVEAARSAGALGVLVPRPSTRASEVAAAERVSPDFNAAVDWLLGVDPALAASGPEGGSA